MRLKMRQLKLENWNKKLNEKTYNIRKNKYTYGFQQLETIRLFGDNIHTGKSNIDEAEIDQRNLLQNVVIVHNNSRPRLKEGKEKKRYFQKCISSLWWARINS